MSGTFQVVSPREFPVRLGDLTFYAAGWKLSGTRQYAQQGGVHILFYNGIWCGILKSTT